MLRTTKIRNKIACTTRLLAFVSNEEILHNNNSTYIFKARKRNNRGAKTTTATKMNLPIFLMSLQALK